VGQLNTNKSENFTSNQKVEIFKNLFTRRIDVYATRWENAKGRSGYSVACYNEWKQNICHKPKVKCGEYSKFNSPRVRGLGGDECITLF